MAKVWCDSRVVEETPAFGTISIDDGRRIELDDGASVV